MAQYLGILCQRPRTMLSRKESQIGRHTPNEHWFSCPKPRFFSYLSVDVNVDWSSNCGVRCCPPELLGDRDLSVRTVFLLFLRT